ncbi:MAG: phage tail protein [Spirochaetia bacterium]|jgi:microcystin-dependent protein
MSVQVFSNGAWVDAADLAAPPGTVLLWGGPSYLVGGVYTGPNTGWLICNGQAISRLTYAALFAVLQTTWGAGDGSTTFNLPDYQETVPIGVGNSPRVEVAHDVYTLAQFKDDQTQGHINTIANAIHNGTGYYMFNGGGPIVCDVYDVTATGDPTADSHGNGTPRTGSVTRGKRIGLNFIIKI